MKKTKRTKKASRDKDQLAVVLEDINHKFDIMVEGQQVLSGKVGKLESRTAGLENRVDGMENEVDGLKHVVNKLDNKVDELGDKVDRGFTAAFGYLSNIENELSGEMKTKINVKDFGILEKRVSRLEKAMTKK